jgi:hypothetical protein
MKVSIYLMSKGSAVVTKIIKANKTSQLTTVIIVMFRSIRLQRIETSQYKQFLVMKIRYADECKSSATSLCLTTGYWEISS